jgi:hypothetical protein
VRIKIITWFGGNNVHKGLKIVGCVLATIGIASVIKYIMHHKEGFCSCGCHKIKVDDEKPADETVSNNMKAEDKKPAGETVSNNIKAEDEKRTGTRYGSNPIRY